MNLRYYLRGLGIGIFVTALIMGVSVKSHPQKMSESEIRAEAAKLGMVDGTAVLQAATEQNEEESKEEHQETSKDATEESEEDEHTVSVNDVVNEEETNGSESDSEIDSEEAGTENSEEAETETPEEVETEEPEESNENTEVESEESEEELEEDTQISDDTQQANEAEESQDAGKTEEAQTVTITIYPGEGSLPVARRLEGLGVVENAVVFDKFLCRNGYDTRIRVGSFRIPVEASNEEIARIITSR